VGPYTLIAPEIALLSTALIAMFGDLLTGGRRRAGATIGAIGAVAAAGLAVWAGRGTVAVFGGMLVVDGAAQFARIATGALTAVFLMWAAGSGKVVVKARQAAVLVLLSALGCMLMSAARDWVVLFLALETATMPLYVLIGFDRGDERSLEGALKYFLQSMVTSITMAYGLSFVLLLTGSTAMTPMRAGVGALGLIAAALVVVALCAKLSAAPLHWWAPDAYAGAPAWAVAFASAVPKVAGVVALARAVDVFAAQSAALRPALATAAVASMIVGNLAAFPQRDVRRMMAYSGIAHAGYLLLAIASGGSLGLLAAVFYSLAYALPSMAVMFVVAEEGPALEDLTGLARRRPGAAWALALLLVSLVGVPPLAGFLGKLYVFSAAVSGGLLWVAVLGVLMSVVSAGYYFRILRSAFFGERVRVDPAPVERNVAASIALALCVAGVIALGVAASPVMALIGLTLP
jgi:NADH-quinone oxidoreductase subunit N